MSDGIIDYEGQIKQQRSVTMEDKAIIDLYLSRSEKAINETDKKYRPFCRSIAFNILRDHGESDECINDTYLKLWNSIPPQIPVMLANYIAKITRNTALFFYRQKHRLKRGGDTVELALSEIAECVDMSSDVENETAGRETAAEIAEFLDSLDESRRVVFLLRYWYFLSNGEIAKRQNISEASVRTSLHRSRKQLKKFLEEKGIYQ